MPTRRRSRGPLRCGSRCGSGPRRAGSCLRRADCSWPSRRVGRIGESPGSSSGRPTTTHPRCSAETSTTWDPTRRRSSTPGSAIFPLEDLGRLEPATYDVQALLHTNIDLNTPNAPGDLYSPVRTVRLDPAAGGPVELRLSRSVPEETLPADSELVKHIKIRSRVSERVPPSADRPARRRDPAAGVRPRARSPIPGAGPHRRLRRPLHRGRRHDVRPLGVPARLDGRRRAADDPDPPRRRRPAGRPVPGRLGQSRPLRRGGHRRADPPHRGALPRHRPRRGPRARRRLDRRLGRPGPPDLLPRLLQRRLVLLPRRRRLPQLRD